jgi:Tfp pilus assembly protein PilF
MRPEAQGAGGRRRDVLLGALLFLATVAAYLPALRGGFVWDDDTTLTNNPLIKASDGLLKFWTTTRPADYWPVTYSALWAEWRLWGANPFWYHLTNVLLHAASACLIAVILGRLFRRSAEASEGMRSLAPWLAAFLFALHPVNVESVAWITQQKNLWAMLFSLLSILTFTPTRGQSTAAATRPTDAPAAKRPDASAEASAKAEPPPFLSLAFFTLAMLSKGSAAPIPVVLLGLILWRRRPDRGDLLRLAPFFLVAAALAAVDVWFQHHGSTVIVRSAGPVERVLGAGAVVWFYLFKALWPANLVFVYPQWHIDAGNPLWWTPAAAALATTWVLWSKRRSPVWRPWLFAWGYFCAMLIPVMGLTDVYFMRYSLVADHYQYLAMISVVAAAAGWLLLRRSFGGPALMLAIALPVVLGVLTCRQCRQYSDLRTLYLTILRGNPDSALAHGNLGAILVDENRLPEAEAQYADALRIDPSATSHYNLGEVYMREGRIPEAIDQYRATVRLDPDYLKAHNNLGGLLHREGRLDEAAAELREAMRLSPETPNIHFNLGNVLADAGRFDEAIAQYRAAVRLKPDYALAHRNLGRALEHIGQFAEGRKEIEAGMRLGAGP